MSVVPTGDLLRLSLWWREHAPGGDRRVAWIVDPIDNRKAREAVDRAVDSGATIIALLARGHDVPARAVISSRAKVTPVDVRDQPIAMSDLEWMSEVAAIRDTRAFGYPDREEPMIAAARECLLGARDRATPVIFDGLSAYAGAVSIGDFHLGWLPASSSTDPAIAVALDHFGVEPALDLKVGAVDDLGIRAVLALLDLVEGD